MKLIISDLGAISELAPAVGEWQQGNFAATANISGVDENGTAISIEVSYQPPVRVRLLSFAVR